MRRCIVFLLLLAVFVSCSKEEKGGALPPSVIPNIISGTVYEINVTPLDITTPDKGFLTIFMNDVLYKVQFDATDSSQSNARLYFATDSILTSESREYANLGRDAIAYNPLAENDIEMIFKDGRKVLGHFSDGVTSFGGTFGEQVIAQWRDPTDPSKPTQKAKDDVRALVRRYADKDGTGPGSTPTYLSVTVSKP